MAHGLELADGSAVLDPIERVLAGQREHRPCRAQDLVAQGELGEDGGGAPRAAGPAGVRAEVDAVGGPLDEAGGRIHSFPLSDAALEHLAFGCADHRSSPRPRSRRAMMWGWISAVPP